VVTRDAIAIPERPGLKVLRDAPMRLHTTWRIGGPADFLVRAATPDDLIAAAAWGRGEGLPVTVLGGGSNLLVADDGIRGLVVLSRTPGERATDLVTVDDLGDRVRLRVAAQAPLSWTGRFAAERGWAGLDWGVGLPGTIGGATVNNAGAHGTEQIDHLERVVILRSSGEIDEKPAAWLEAAYRHTIIKAAPRPRPWIVVAAVMLLPKSDPAELVRLADEHAEFRKLTQPTGACAGSTFANPPGDFAGRLLEESGLKGFAIGGARFSPKHANWIVNDGTATAADVRELIDTARQRVQERFGVELRREVEYVGDVG
jgi:UDP-N-acetylmuramate dehydrogenase